MKWDLLLGRLGLLRELAGSIEVVTIHLGIVGGPLSCPEFQNPLASLVPTIRSGAWNNPTLYRQKPRYRRGSTSTRLCRVRLPRVRSPYRGFPRLLLWRLLWLWQKRKFRAQRRLFGDLTLSLSIRLKGFLYRTILDAVTLQGGLFRTALEFQRLTLRRRCLV